MRTKEWFLFWFSFPPVTTVRLRDIKLQIRTGSFHEKIVDLYMAVSCIVWKQYEHPGYNNRNSTIIDIGGHIGSFSLWASQQAKQVLVFEPDKNNLELLVQNIKINGFKNIIAVNKAVMGTSEKVTLFRNSKNSAGHSVLFETDNKSEVNSLSLDDLFKEYKIDTCNFMKLDCEGAEFAILTKASDETLQKIERLSMEYHTGYNLNILVERLVNAGFKITKNERDTSYQGQIWAVR